MKKQNIISIILLLTVLISIFQSSKVDAGLYQSSSWAVLGSGPLQGQRVSAHDFNAIVSDNYYGMLYVDSGSNLFLRALNIGLLSNTGQKILNNTDWLPSKQYAVSNLVGETFYVAYQFSLTQLILAPITFNYVSTGQFNGFTMGSKVAIRTSATIVDGGLSLIIGQDNSIWLTVSELASKYQVEVFNILKVSGSYQSSSIAVISVTDSDVPLSSISLLNGNTPVVFTWGRFKSIHGTLYMPLSSTTAVYSTNNLVNAVSSVSTSNLTVKVVIVEGLSLHILTVNNNAQLSDSALILNDNVLDVGLYSMFNSQYGFYWINPSSLNTIYWGKGQDGNYAYSNIIQVAQFTANQITQLSVDFDGGSRLSLAHPAALLFNSTGAKSLAVATDLPSQQFVTYTTVSSSTTTSTTSTQISTSTRAWTTITLSTMTNVTAAVGQSPTFMVNTAIIGGMVLLPAMILGLFLGLLGVVVGLIIGSSIGVSTGTIPLWIAVLSIILTVGIVVLYRDEVLSNVSGPLLRRGSGGNIEENEEF